MKVVEVSPYTLLCKKYIIAFRHLLALRALPESPEPFTVVPAASNLELISAGALWQ